MKTRLFSMVAALTLVAGLSACATPSRPEAMTLAATTGLVAAPGDTGYKSVATVVVNGGSETNPLWTAQVSNADLKKALEASLDAAGYLGSEGRPLTVTANMVELNQPMAGLGMSVNSRIQYQVSRDGQTIFNDTVAATGTAGLSDALAAVERLRIANERSVQENIKEFLKRFRATAS